MNPRYTVIVPHYDQSVSDKKFIRGMNCLLNQTEQNFEVLIYHDGPISRPIPDIYKNFGDKCKLTITDNRANDWGHSNRDRGIREATGEWIVHFNPDNIVYEDLLSEISKLIDDASYPVFSTQDNKLCPSQDIIIFPIYMVGYYRFGLPGFNGARVMSHTDRKYLMNGDPCLFANIDCLQLVMKRNLWLKYGGWYDKRSFGDGVMYERFVREQNGAKYCGKVLGEHW
jgi:hypothetical protein